ncbi:nucleolin 1 isoform X2 [Hevea brasiliensis]|nr:nucleolin 1 isoform X2 [Hevea brasiliensis]
MNRSKVKINKDKKTYTEMAPKKQPGPRPKRAVRSTAKRAVPDLTPIPSSDSLTAVKSPHNGETKTTAKSASESALLPASSPAIENGTTSATSSVTVPAEPLKERAVDEKRQNSSMETQNEKISAGNETLAQENDARIEEKDLIGGSGNANGDSGNDNLVAMEPKKKTKKVVVKVVKKLVKKRVPKYMHKAVTACSNKELTTEEVLDDGGDKISSVDCVSLTMQEIGMVKLSAEPEDKGLEKQPKLLDGDGNDSMPKLEVGGVDSSISVPVRADKSDACVTLSMEEAKNPDQPFGVSMEAETFKTMGGGGKEVSVNEIPVDGEKSEGVVEKSDAATKMPAEVMNVNLVRDRNNECVVQVVESNSGIEEGGKEDSEMGNGRIVLSGELEALERRRRRKTEIFIGGLNTDAKEEDVRKVFEEVGDIVEVRLVINSKTGKNKGFAFVRYASAADAKKALEKYPKAEICGKRCTTAPVEGNDTIFLGNLDKRWTNEDVVKLLHEMGIEKIDKVTVMPDPSNVGRNRGFAFLELETNKDAQFAFKKLQKNDQGKLRNIKVAWAEPLSEPVEEELLKVKSVYAEYLPSSWDEEKVRSYFTKFGEIENVVLSRNLPSSRRKDFAFVNFKTREAALTCIELFNHERLSDKGSQVNVKLSLAKPMQKGKAHKKVSKPTGKEVSKQKQSSQGPAKQVELRNSKTPAIRIDDQILGDIRSSRTAELERRLAERALQKQMQARLSSGMANWDYSQALPGQKRSFFMLGDDLNYSDPRGYTRIRTESSYPVGSLSHGDVPPGVGMDSLSYYQRQGHRYPDYANSFQREEPPYHGTGRDDYKC